ncbi:MAG: TSUP family transporter [Vicinamibacterales bacterium]
MATAGRPEAIKTEPGEPAGQSVWREIWREQAPLVIVTLAAGFVAAYWQHGFLPGGDVGFPLAGVKVPIWHLVWMGFWTGYTMAVVGEAAGIFALPYQISILQFGNVHVTPTTQLLTLLNPLGALLGFHRTRQTNWDFALWVCAGGMVGAVIGPFIRLTALADPKPFIVATGLALAITGLHLCVAAFRGLRVSEGFEGKFAAAVREARVAGRTPSGLPHGVGIETVAKGGGLLTIVYWGESWTMSTPVLFLVGLGVGIVSATLGVGGGFLLVPIFAAFYRLPIYVLVAASIPYVLSLSAVSLLTYSVIAPLFTGIRVPAEFAWGLFASAGGILGSWLAAKTQRFVPQPLLKLMLGAITGIAGVLYLLGGFVDLPFRV